MDSSIEVWNLALPYKSTSSCIEILSALKGRLIEKANDFKNISSHLRSAFSKRMKFGVMDNIYAFFFFSLFF